MKIAAVLMTVAASVPAKTVEIAVATKVDRADSVPVKIAAVSMTVADSVPAKTVATLATANSARVKTATMIAAATTAAASAHAPALTVAGATSAATKNKRLRRVETSEGLNEKHFSAGSPCGGQPFFLGSGLVSQLLLRNLAPSSPCLCLNKRGQTIKCSTSLPHLYRSASFREA